MASAEIEGVTWAGPARWFTKGRDGFKPCMVVIHYTAGAEGRTAAENGAAYDRRRPDRVSTHFFVDSDSVVQEVLLRDTAYAAYGKANRLGVQIEICGTLQTRAQWFDAVSTATLDRAAWLTAKLCRMYNLEPRRLTLPEVRAAWDRYPRGPRGIIGHVDATYGYGQGDHTDPGPQFPWDWFTATVRAYLGAGPENRGGKKKMLVLQLNQPNGKGGIDSSWWKTDTLHCDQIMTWERVQWHCAVYGQATPYDHQFSDKAEFAARVGVDVTPDPAGVNIDGGAE